MLRPANVVALPNADGTGARDRFLSVPLRLSDTGCHRNHGGARIRGDATNRDQQQAYLIPAADLDFLFAREAD